MITNSALANFVTLDEVRDTLKRIPNDVLAKYENYFRVMAGTKRCGYPNEEKLYEVFDARLSQAPGYDAEENRKHWDALGDHDKGVTWASVRYMAGATKSTNPYQWRSVRELFDNPPPPPEFLIENFLVKGSPAFVGARPKCFKSLLFTTFMPYSLAYRSEFLGYKINRNVNVAVAINESSDEFKHNVHLMAKSYPPEGYCCDMLYLDQVPSVRAGRDNPELDLWFDGLRDQNIEVLVIDPFYFIGVNQASLSETGDVLNQVAKRATQLGITLIYIHHLAKRHGSQSEPTREHFCGDGIANYAGQWYLMSAYDQWSKGAMTVNLSWGGRANHEGNIRVRVDVGTCNDRKFEVNVVSEANLDGALESETEKILSHFKDGKIHSSELTALLTTQALRQAKIRLIDDGVIKEVRRNNKRYYEVQQ